MSNDYNYEVGHEGLRNDFRRYQKQTPKGVTLVRSANAISLQFKVGNKNRSKYGCNCSFTLDGMVNALNKACKVADALKSFTSETEFWDWYKKEILEEGKIENDLLTFGEAIAVIKNDFWNRTDRRKQKRSKNNPSDLSSWNDTYYRFYKYLPLDKPVNQKSILETLEKWKKGTKSYKSATSVFKKLASVANKKSIIEVLDNLDITQTEFNKLQSITLLDFLNWRDRILGITVELHPNCDLNTRKAWLWAFSIQVVYGLRIHEVFAIKNLTEPFEMKDGVIMPALNNSSDTDNLLVIGKLTDIGTKTKTYERLARPLLPNKYLNLIEQLDIKKPLLPNNKPRGNNANSIRKFYCNTAIRQLARWNAPFTQTHALRHLANLHGMQAGISLEVRAQSMGHTPAMNDSVYKKRQHTQTTIDILLNSNKQAIDFTSGLIEAKRVLEKYPNSTIAIVELLAKVYQKSETDIEQLLQ